LPNTSAIAKVNAEIRNRLKQMEQIETDGAQQFIAKLDELRRLIVMAIVEEREITAYTSTQLKNRIAELVERFRPALEAQLTENQRRLFVKGIQMIDATLKTADLLVAVPYLSEQLLEQARNFGAELITGITDDARRRVATEINLAVMGQKPLIISPYDAELFGHWWFEGPMWLEYLFRKIHHDQNSVKTITPLEYLEANPRNQVVTPSMSSWGYNGYAEVWLNGSNDWIYRHLHKAAERMIEVTNRRPQAEGLEKRALNQMARELLLAQSSDWAFIMKTGTHTSYASKRTTEHLERFTRLWSQINENYIDTNYLQGIESTDNIFPEIDYRTYLS